MGQWDESTIDSGSDTRIPDCCVDRIREINWARSERQGNHATFGGENKDLILIKIGFQTLHELCRISDIALPVNNAIEPINVGYFAVVFVGPVGGDSPFGPLMHFASTNLNFEWFSAGTDNGCMQTLIQVEFGHCDIILEATDDRFPSSVDTSQSRVTIFDRVNNDTNSHDVENFVELFTFLDHLLVDAPQMFPTPGDVSVDIEFRQLRTNVRHRFGEIDIAFRAAAAHEVIKLGITLRVHRGKRQVF